MLVERSKDEVFKLREDDCTHEDNDAMRKEIDV